MGRKTWDSLPKRPLPNRLNIVVTRSVGSFGEFPNTKAVDSLIDAVEIGRDQGLGIYIIGGSQIYSESLRLGLVDRIIVSKIPGEYECDVFFPDLEGWTLVEEVPRPKV